MALAILALGGLLWLESNPVEQRAAMYEQKLQAARLAEESFRSIYLERIRLQIPLEPKFDPAGSGLIGPVHSVIVSNRGHLPSKQTSANPNFAAMLVGMLRKAGVEEGDHVAANLTGSFPAMNICLYTAMEVMDVRPIVTSSVSASEYGATHPELTWLDMERVLYEQDLISFRSVAASMGGVGDVAKNHSSEGKEAIRAAIVRNGRSLLLPSNYEEAVTRRLQLYDDISGQEDPAAFVNIGGGTAAVGTSEDKNDFRYGLNRELPRGLEHVSVMRSFLERDVPVIHVSHIRTLARRYGLPDRPVTVPEPGKGGVFRKAEIPEWAIVAMLLGILFGMFAATRFDVASVFARREEAKKGPEQMV
jgi:poly-gamma-glutamate system protein